MKRKNSIESLCNKIIIHQLYINANEIATSIVDAEEQYIRNNKQSLD